ncbi:EexN family lipoprotein [Xylella fastidiosa]|uniref:EexN family lipoprotein n=1 Tax=Xylella fastidiosa TaxID=2371 RepID=UPI001120BFBC|nr:EexN family lipoprotein [Xylella fastidiosa]TNW18201.1 hypothetical protein EIP73_12530 [Xylella fastidiosa subsp. pauca]
MSFLRALIVGTALAALAACTPKPPQISFLDRVLTVEEFTAQPDVRDKVIAECSSDPGHLKDDPNCFNAKQSLRASTTGSGNFPSLDITPPQKKGNSK